MPIKTWVGRFAIVQGQAQEESALLRSFPRQRPDEEEDELYVLVEPASERSIEYAGQLVDAIGRMYRQDTLSITGAVLRALKAAQQQLLDWNERNLKEHRVGAGVSCMAVRGHSAYLAQIGPAVAYHVGGGRYRRIVPEGPAVEPLGHAEGAEPVFSRYELSPGDLLLIASPNIEKLLSEEELRAILLRGGDDALVELFRIASDVQDFSLVLLACVVEPDEAAGEAPAEPVAESAPATTVTPPGEPAPATASEPATPAVAAPAAAGAPPPPPDLAQPNVRIKGPEADIRYRRSTGLAAGLPRVPLQAVIALVVLAAVVVLAWFVVPSWLQDSRDDRFADLVSSARTSLESALATDDPAQRRAALDAAAAALADADLQQPDTAEVAALRVQVDVEKAKLDAVLLLPELELIIDISERISGPVSAKDLALGGGGAYFLDREQSRVIAISLLGAEPEPFVLLEEGRDLVGGEIVGAPQHIAWAEELGSLLIMDASRRLIAVVPTEAGRLLPVRDADAWGSADGIDYRDGSLYVLDRAGDQVWLYLPSDSGFDSERVTLLDAFDLDQVVELAVGDVLYLVMADDTIVRFPGSVARPFTQAGIDLFLSSPASLVAVPAAGMLLVADRGNARIAVFSPDGTFLQQLVSPSFTDLRALAVDEPNGLLYILSGGRLYRTPLPPLP
ncbi:MAG: hypothetical protein IIB23_02395 [Chloroflexi bacterium]|nr:hypothetical protein [Chloroflexota bacterium]